MYQGLLGKLGQFLSELGRDLCFLGTEFPVNVGKQHFVLDLLFFHRGLNAMNVTTRLPRIIGRCALELLSRRGDIKRSTINKSERVMRIRTTALSGLQHLASALKVTADKSATPSSALSAPSRNTPKELEFPRQRWTDAGPRSRLMKLGVIETHSQKKLKGKDDDGSASSPPLGTKSGKSVAFNDKDDVRVFDNTKPPVRISKPHIRFNPNEAIRTFDNTQPVLDISTPRKKVTFKEADDVRRFDKEKPASDVAQPQVKSILKKNV